ncbi:MAG: HAD family hydrolase [Paracoccaceae bacterium]
MRIAMWSGPRNLSTAMMYAFAARNDCTVWDEPFYAAYLKETGLSHPMREEILKTYETDPQTVARHCAGASPGGAAIFYQKHMCHHMVAGFPTDWALDCTNIFLIRHPARVIASYSAKREAPTLEDLGFAQQARLFETLGGGLVIDSTDMRADPEARLRALCKAISIPFQPGMLHWPAGGITQDGIWAAHWYDAIHRSTGFAGAEGPLPELTGQAAALERQALPYYEALRAYKLDG